MHIAVLSKLNKKREVRNQFFFTYFCNVLVCLMLNVFASIICGNDREMKQKTNRRGNISTLSHPDGEYGPIINIVKDNLYFLSRSSYT